MHFGIWRMIGNRTSIEGNGRGALKKFAVDGIAEGLAVFGSAVYSLIVIPPR